MKGKAKANARHDFPIRLIHFHICCAKTDCVTRAKKEKTGEDSKECILQIRKACLQRRLDHILLVKREKSVEASRREFVKDLRK